MNDSYSFHLPHTHARLTNCACVFNRKRGTSCCQTVLADTLLLWEPWKGMLDPSFTQHLLMCMGGGGLPTLPGKPPYTVACWLKPAGLANFPLMCMGTCKLLLHIRYMNQAISVGTVNYLMCIGVSHSPKEQTLKGKIELAVLDSIRDFSY